MVSIDIVAAARVRGSELGVLLGAAKTIDVLTIFVDFFFTFYF